MRTRKPAAERRAEIARTALRIIGECGLTSLTTTKLAQEVGVTSGALFRHFESLDAILEAAVREALDRIEETFPDPELPPVERLLLLARNRIRVVGGDPGISWLLRSEQAFLTLPEEAVAQLRSLVDRSKRFLLDALREGVERGTVRGDIPPEVLIVPVMGTIHALVGLPGIHRATTRRGPSPDRVLAALEQLLAPPSASK